MNAGIQPPEGKKCFSGIPEAHFIDDVDSYMKGDESAEAKIKELDEVSMENKAILKNSSKFILSGTSEIQIHGD